ncbi:MAG: divergent polysaccharide deacetylase family protein [Gammaproteobacteria bacterium]|nr:divergent polysaccharide deacetylase family protein [Gammaproteobacteria bacterium]
MLKKRRHILPFFFLLLAFQPCTGAQPGSSRTAYISIIIDDLGYRLHDDLRAVALPGPVICAIMPHAPYSTQLAELAHQQGKEIILHQPLEALQKNEYLGPGALTLDMTEQEFTRTFRSNMASVPHMIGVNNHMGSLLTQHPGHMGWLMSVIKQHHLFFIDSVTSDNSIAAMIAHEKNIPYLERDIFFDNVQKASAIEKQFGKLLQIARVRGTAVGIGHPYPETMNVLTRVIQELDPGDVKLVGLKSLYSKRNGGSGKWQASSSHSLRVVKNSKP